MPITIEFRGNLSDIFFGHPVVWRIAVQQHVVTIPVLAPLLAVPGQYQRKWIKFGERRGLELFNESDSLFAYEALKTEDVYGADSVGHK